MSTAPSIKLHLYFADEADRAVILRQGPSRVFRLILWDTATDRFEYGQWVKHKVYPERCSLSPDGRHFLYFALNGQWNSETKGAFTALSQPPWFTALALWPQGHTWGGGGYFLDNEHVFLQTERSARDIVGRAPQIRRVFHDSPLRDQVRRARAVFSGSPRPEATGYIYADGSPAAVRYTAIRQRHHLHHTKGGVLYRRRGQEITPLRDFTQMTFSPMRAPYDWRAAPQP